ncbi:MAG: hypothetical protein LBG65_05675 [Puniceicoccales bacterium]|nr:hypothetical protein [Puniceicoccales bacterium]
MNGFELKKFSIPREKNLRLRVYIWDDVKIKGFRTYRKIGLLPFYFDLRSEDLAGAVKAGSSGPVKLEDGICVGGDGSSLTLQISDFPEKGWRSSLLFSSLLFSSLLFAFFLTFWRLAFRENGILKEARFPFFIFSVFLLLAGCLFPVTLGGDGKYWVGNSFVLQNLDWQNWNFFRPFMYSFVLASMWELAGGNAASTLLANGIFILLAVFFLGKSFADRGRQYCLALCLLAFSPTLVAFQHLVANECALFCALALVVFALERFFSSESFSPANAVFLVFSCVFAFYIKQNFMPVFVALGIFFLARPVFSFLPVRFLKDDPGFLSNRRCVTAAALIFFSMIFMFSYFSESMKRSGFQTEWGVVRNLAVPEGYYKDPKVSDAYRELELRERHGKFFEDPRKGGIPNSAVFDFLNRPPDSGQNDILTEAWKQNPAYCLDRALKAFPAFAFGDVTVKSSVSEVLFLARHKTRVMTLEFADSWQVRTASNPIGAFYCSLLWHYKGIHFAILILLPFSFGIGVVRRDYFCAFGSLLIFSFLAMHAFCLFSYDRYAVPAFWLGYFLLIRTLFLYARPVFEKIGRRLGLGRHEPCGPP